MKEISITKEEFIYICNNAKNKQDAYNKLNMHRNTFEKYCSLFGVQKFRKNRDANKYNLEDIFNGKHENYPTSKLHYRLIKEGYKKEKCECCGLTEWLGNKIPLELHHIDGNRHNHSLNNLMLLCPNCHSITDNFKSKNIKHYSINN